jgi:DMSO/TMAO reductase YedYZ molybdopterin-dependent catalytic subunit
VTDGTSDDRARPFPPRAAGAIVGILTAGVGLSVGQLVSIFVAGESSPVLAVGQSVVMLSPEWLKSFAIRHFGSHDKLVLITGVVVVLIVASALLGIAALRHRWIGDLGVAAFGVIGVVAAMSQPDASTTWVLPSVVGALAAWIAFRELWRAAQPEETHPMGGAAGEGALDRRRFLKAAAVTGAGAVAAQGFALALAPRFMAGDISRASTKVPVPADPASPVPPGASLKVPGLSPFFTPNSDFYRVDTTLFPPQIAADKWRLRIHGMVDHEMTIDYGQLLAREMVERDITLCCVSNPVGGPYIGNARWIGALAKPLLEEAGVHPGADQLVMRSPDGMTIGAPVAALMDGRDAMLAVAMNGQPLPVEHGFPVRMVVPGLYGYVSACKWIVDMELTTFAAYDAYWVPRGWSQQGPIKTESRIDVPIPGAVKPAGTVVVAGIAWAQHVGISKVEVRVDNGPWHEAELSTQDTLDTWRQWRWEWPATKGTHVVQVRATDANGVTQTSVAATPAPNGATGWHQSQVTIV